MAENYGQTAGSYPPWPRFYSTNAMEIMGMGFIFAILLKIPYWQAVLLAAVIVVVYTIPETMGGTTDMIQFLSWCEPGHRLLICWEDLGGYAGCMRVWRPTWAKTPGITSPLGRLLTSGSVLPTLTSHSSALRAFMQQFSPRALQEMCAPPADQHSIWTAYEFACCLGMAAVAGLDMIGETHANQALLAVVINLPTGDRFPGRRPGRGHPGRFLSSSSPRATWFTIFTPPL